MTARSWTVILSAILLLVGAVHAESTFKKEFDDNYDQINRDLLNHTGQRAEIADFVYQKDLATITFKKGSIHLLRYVNDRPTTAIFIGQGHIDVAVPSHSERMTLLSASGDSTVSQDFETCFIRFADNLDLKLEELFAFEPKELSWKEFNVGAKKPQGEVFFKPKMTHTYDNYFQLLRSCYERADDGYFFVDFNRYIYTFDPNRPEESIISYEWHGGDLDAFEACRIPRAERNNYDDLGLSHMNYPTTALSRSGVINIAGLDGKSLDSARVDFEVQIDRDSLRFISLFLHNNLKLDSLYANGVSIDFKRRNDFDFTGVVLPEYAHKGDVVKFTLFYHGNDFDQLLPWVENPIPTTIDLSFVTPRGYNYFIPGKEEVVETSAGQQFRVAPTDLYDRLDFECFASGVDTISVVSESGAAIDFLDWELMDKKYSDCYIPDEVYQPSVVSAVDYMVTTFGPRLWSSHFWVSASGNFDMPGILTVPQISCVSEGQMAAFGGVDMLSGRAAAGQWFAATLQYASNRDKWILESMPEYVGIMYIQDKLGAAAYSNLINRRDSLYFVEERGEEVPLSAGDRVSVTQRTNKGLWVFHMLRGMMTDLESFSDRPFRSFLHQVSSIAGMQPIDVAMMMQLAEKQYGQSLDWFAREWIYDFRIPEFDVSYSVNKAGDQWMVTGTVEIKGVADEFKMPVVIQVVNQAGGALAFVREEITGPKDSFELGPYQFEPDKIVFGEFYSVLGHINTNKK
ncbi:MAG TPA: hypothetical protein PLF13_03070 [candidate division Zixibacteria bacterium]|nr:hypothetical protein [candidate division Zixibacteria bacterium]